MAVVRDLLPVYAAGEASPETCSLVDEALHEDAALRAEVENLREIPTPQAGPPFDAGRVSMERTQALLRRRGSLMAFSLIASSAPLALVGRNWTPLLLGRPISLWIAAVGAVAATVGWAFFLRNVSRLRVLGFEPRFRFRIRLAWAICSWWYFTAVGLLAFEWSGGPFVPLALLAVLGAVVLFLQGGCNRRARG
jgi:hypothetical protein